MRRIPNGTTVWKCNSEKGDGHKDGAEATVVSSIGPAPFKGDPEVYGYMVRWMDLPEIPVFCAGTRLTTEKGE
jgi:hypothetical protein